MAIELRRDGAVVLDGEVIGYVFGQPRDWGFMLADSRMPAKTRERGWHSKREAADMCARAHQETPQAEGCSRAFIPRENGVLQMDRICYCGKPSGHELPHVCLDCGGRWGEGVAGQED